MQQMRRLGARGQCSLVEPHSAREIANGIERVALLPTGLHDRGGVAHGLRPTCGPIAAARIKTTNDCYDSLDQGVLQ